MGMRTPNGDTAQPRASSLRLRLAVPLAVLAARRVANPEDRVREPGGIIWYRRWCDPQRQRAGDPR
eukprot:526564-Prymnesium_polylepis.1